MLFFSQIKTTVDVINVKTDTLARDKNNTFNAVLTKD